MSTLKKNQFKGPDKLEFGCCYKNLSANKTIRLIQEFDVGYFYQKNISSCRFCLNFCRLKILKYR